MSACTGCATEIPDGLARCLPNAHELADHWNVLAAAFAQAEQAEAGERRRVAREAHPPCDTGRPRDQAQRGRHQPLPETDWLAEALFRLRCSRRR